MPPTERRLLPEVFGDIRPLSTRELVQILMSKGLMDPATNPGEPGSSSITKDDINAATAAAAAGTLTGVLQSSQAYAGGDGAY